MSSIFARRLCATLSLLALPFLVGSQCAFFFSSGDNSDDERREDDGTTIIVASSGTFGAPPVAGINYESGALAGITNDQGEFRYEEGRSVSFAIGEIELGTATTGKSLVTTQDLASASSSPARSAINLLRLLVSLDDDPDSDVITIPDSVRKAAVQSNTSIASAITLMDYADDVTFANSASQLLAVLTYDYPRTVSLVEASEIPLRQIKLDSEPQR